MIGARFVAGMLCVACEFSRDRDDIDKGTVSPHGHLHPSTDRAFDHQGLDIG